MGLLMNGKGKALAVYRQMSEARMVVVTAPWKPKFKNSWAPSETPKMLLPVPGMMFNEQMDPTKKKLPHTVS